MDKIIITGGTGFIGLSLAEHLSKKGLQPVLIARNKPERETEFDFVPWNGLNLGDWVNSLAGALAVVNLAGRSVDCIKTPDNCDVILRSRVDSTKVIGKALQAVQNPPKIWIQMSTAHIYGDPPSALCTEYSTTGYGLAPFVGKAWEEALLHSKPEGVREVRLRTSFVIGRNGGALSKLKRIAQLGLGGRVGDGRQGISWIHEYDMNEIFYQSIVNQHFNGVYIASSPNPVSNAAFMKELRRTLKIPIGMPAPAWITRVGARLLFKTDPELALYGRYVKSERLEQEGFRFMFPRLKEAMENLLG
jgi:uncharacterized protein (TIGR01777 family)